ncbi:MAG: HD domain-containing protein [Deltaproteobacteria bacterium]|nr:HD domain-containing protein [Deltaproteobacteria bacterium]
MSDKQSIPERFGHDFLRALYHMINTVRIYQDNNQLVRKSLRTFRTLLDLMAAEDDISLFLWRGRFYIGEQKLPYVRDAATVVNAMIDFFSKRGIGSIIFLQSSRTALPEDVLAFSRLLDDSIKDGDPLSWLDQQLREEKYSWVQLFRKHDDDEASDGESADGKRYEKARQTYFHAVETVKEVANKLSQSMVGVRKARRLAQTIVDLIREDTSLMIGLTTIKDFDDYTYTHSVNVALLATCLGRYIGLSDVSLEHLAVCGLFHDLGKVGVSKDILLKEGALTDGEWEQMKKHPLIGVRKILMLNAPQSLRSRIIIAPFEHHLNPDMTGYPRTLFMVRLSLMGKILRIADVYEALTAERVYRPMPFTPDETLRKMWLAAGTNFDTVLLKSFIKMMGIYPIGSVVELGDGSIGLVMDYPNEFERGMPLVLRLVDKGNGDLKRGELVYISDEIPASGSDRLNIVRGIPPGEVHINPAEFFLHVK